ncbi:MAG: glycosyltransferase family 39 protein [Gemmatimonadetes bacterium]|nr:glycosyltransferase family 39 protein [Gemmatimonadota bacterium]
MSDFIASIKANFNKRYPGIHHAIVKHYFTSIIILIIFFAFILRYFQLNIGLPYLYFWDEPLTASNALQMMKTEDYNPHFFKYGSLMIYLNLLIDQLYYIYLLLTGDLASVTNIRIEADTGWHWTISHPGFYFWNRFLTATMGTATVFITYLISRSICGRWTGIISAFFLSVLPIHIVHSGFVTMDAPVALFVSLVALFSILFIDQKKIIYFILGLICVGFATATKYNSGLAILLPVASLIWMSYRDEIPRQKFYWLAIPCLPAVTFFFIMPYAILDFPNFIKDVLHQINYYKTTGHPGATISPGWDYFAFQIREFYHNIGLTGTILFAIGLAGIISRPVLLLILLFPASYLVFMSDMTVSFHRNFIQVYPFIAIFAGIAFYNLHLALARFYPKLKKPIPIVCLAAALVLLPRAYDAYQTGLELHNTRDTRSAVIDTLNAMENVQQVVFARELRVHEQDLNRLKCDYSIQPIEIMSTEQNRDHTHYVLPVEISQIYTYYPEEIQTKQAIIDKIPGEHILQYIDSNYIGQNIGKDYIKQSAATMLDVFSTSPSLIIANQIPQEPLHPGTIAFDTCKLSPTGAQINIRNTATLRDGAIKTPSYALKRGKYLFTFQAQKSVSPERSQSFVFGEYETKITVKRLNAFRKHASIRVSIFADQALLTQQIFILTKNLAQMDAFFSLEKNQRVSVQIENLHPVETTVKQLKILAL